MRFNILVGGDFRMLIKKNLIRLFRVHKEKKTDVTNSAGALSFTIDKMQASCYLYTPFIFQAWGNESNLSASNY